MEDSDHRLNGQVHDPTPGEILRAMVDFFHGAIVLLNALDRECNPAVQGQRDVQRVMRRLPQIVDLLDAITRRVEKQEEAERHGEGA